jgi:hypothetical protein
MSTREGRETKRPTRRLVPMPIISSGSTGRKIDKLLQQF